MKTYSSEASGILRYARIRFSCGHISTVSFSHSVTTMSWTCDPAVTRYFNHCILLFASVNIDLFNSLLYLQESSDLALPRDRKIVSSGQKVCRVLNLSLSMMTIFQLFNLQRAVLLLKK
jgi:hypothetical protein